MSAFSFDNIGIAPVDDPQAKILNNALRRFCDKVEQDDVSHDNTNLLTLREVIWQYGGLRFRGKLATLDGQFSSGEYFYSNGPNENWVRLPTPRALAEKLAEARERSSGQS